MERVRQSDTWALTLTKGWEPKALLLWMWSVAWEQEPCGSFPNDEALIAARLELPAKAWEKHRSILMRNWWLASDGRLYHDTVTVRVLAMLDKRANDAQRAANRRARKADTDATHAGLTPESRVTHTGVHPEFDTKHQAPEPTSLRSGKKAKAVPPPTLSPSDLAEAGFSEELAAEFIACKAGRKAPLTARAWADHLREAAKAGWTPVAAAEKVMGKTWKGFEAKYVADEPKRDGSIAPPKTFRERNDEVAAARIAEFSPHVAAKPVRSAAPLTEVFDVAARRLG